MELQKHREQDVCLGSRFLPWYMQTFTPNTGEGIGY